MELQLDDGNCPKPEVAGCLVFRSLLAEHDVIMAEYEIRARELEDKPPAKRVVELNKFKHFLQLGEQLLEEARRHAQVHGCVLRDPAGLASSPQAPTESRLNSATCLENDLLKLLFCKKRSDLLNIWVQRVNEMSALAKVLAQAALSRARHAEAVQQLRFVRAACIQSASIYYKHNIEHRCSRHPPKPAETVNIFPGLQENPNSFSVHYIGEHSGEQPQL